MPFATPEAARRYQKSYYRKHRDTLIATARRRRRQATAAAAAPPEPVPLEPVPPPRDDQRTFAEGPLTQLALRVPASLVAQIDAHRAQLQRDYPWLTVNRSDAARDLLMRALQAAAGTEAAPPTPQWRLGSARPRLPVALSGVRLQVHTLLRAHPHGLTPAQVRERLGAPKDLAPTIRSMYRDGLLRRVSKGVYTTR